MNTNTINTTENTSVLSTKEQRKLEKQTLFANNVKSLMTSITADDTAITIENTKLTEKDFEFSEDGFADLTKYTNLNNPELEKQFKLINKYRKGIRINLVHIGGVLFDIQQNKTYKKNAKDFGMKSNRFEEFCSKVLGISKTSAYRYIAVYCMCADITGKIDERVACLNASQLYALAANKVTHSDIVGILDTIDDITDTKTAETLLAGAAQKLIEEKQIENAKTAETSQSGTENTKTITPNNNSMTTPYNSDTHVMFKCTIKGGNPLFIPRELIKRPMDVVNYIYDETDYTFETCKHENIIANASWGGRPGGEYIYLAIVIHDDNNKNCLTYLYKEKMPTKDENK